jgi:energy-converting hydrogenase Eha subunit C
MLSLFTRRMPFLGVVIGVALVVWGVAHHSVLLEAIGCVVTVVGVVRTIAALRRRR